MSDLSSKPNQNGPLSLRDRVQSLRLPDRAPARRSPLALLPWILCLGFVASTVVLAMRQQNAASTAETEEARKKAEEQSQVAILPAGINPGDVMLESKGYILPIQQIQVSPKVSGMVTALRFEESMFVKKGFILAELEDIEYKSDHDRTRGMADTAWARWAELVNGTRPEEIEQALADLSDASAQHEQELARYKSAQAINGTAMSREDREVFKAKVDQSQARVQRATQAYKLALLGARWEKIAAAYADVVQFEADYAKAKWRLDNCKVRAPVDGIILTKRAEQGSLVNPSAFSNGLSASLCDMADLTKLEVDLSIPERDVARLIAFQVAHKNKPQKCQVRPDAFTSSNVATNKVYEGYVSRIMPTADRAKGAVPVRVRIIVPPSEASMIFLRPDMGAAVTFLNEESSFTLPLLADEPK